VGLVLPDLEGRLDGVAIRVPVPNVSVIDLTFEAARDTDIEEINAADGSRAAGPLKGILATTDQPNVSMDFNHDPHSSIFHPDQTRVLEGSCAGCWPGTTTNGLFQPHARHRGGDGRLE
jgi:glyceraldehyde 3-phosphate dehydrogenase